MQIVFSDAQYWENFLPLTYTRPIAEIRFGILSFSERWQKLLQLNKTTYITEDYLQNKYPKPEKSESLFLVPNFLPTETVLTQIKNLQLGEALVFDNELIAARVNMENFSIRQIEKMTDITEDLLFIKKSTDIFTYNKEAIDFDFKLLTENRTSQPLSSTNGFIGDQSNLFIEEGATIEFSTLNCKEGKIYIGKNSEIMEGCNIRAPFVLGEESRLSMGTKIYGATSIGAKCKIGGEIKNSVFFGNSNKSHEGFIGDSVIGEWCNMGADTNCSNLKNNYSSVKLWSYKANSFLDSGLMFAGVIMGDHSKTAINTQINTGTVIGVATNIFRNGTPPTLVKSFSWGGFDNDPKYEIEKAIEVANIVMKRRQIEISDNDKEILKYIFNNFS